MGLSMIGGSGATTAEVATSLPRRCLGAIEDCEEILGDLDEEDEGNWSSEKS